MATVSEAVGARGSVFQYWLLSAVKSRGAVSPAARATASKQAVTIPLIAVRITTRRLVRQFATPSASDASRSDPGTSLTSSSVARARVGIMMIASATAPARPEKCPIGTTTSAYATMPTTIDGTPESTSAMKRTVLPTVPSPFSAR